MITAALTAGNYRDKKKAAGGGLGVRYEVVGWLSGADADEGPEFDATDLCVLLR